MTTRFTADMLNKLQRAVDAWSGDLTSPSEVLEHEIAEGRKLLTTIVLILRRQGGFGPDVPPEDITHLESTIANAQAQIEEASAQIEKDRLAAQELHLDHTTLQNKLEIATTEIEELKEEISTLKNTPTQSLSDIPPTTPETGDELERAAVAHSQREHHLEESDLIEEGPLPAEQPLTGHDPENTPNHEHEAELQSLREATTAAERRAHQLEENQEALEAQIAKLHTQIEENDAAIGELSQKIDTLIEEKSDLQNTNDATKQDYQLEVENLNEQNTDLRNEIDTLKNTAEELEEIKKTSTDTNAKHQAQQQKHDSAIQDYQNQIDSLSENNTELKHEAKDLQSEVEILKKFLADLDEAPQTDSDHQTPEQTEEQRREEEEKEIKAKQWLEKVQHAALELQQEVLTLKDAITTPDPTPDQQAQVTIDALQKTIQDQEDALIQKQQIINNLELDEPHPHDTPTEEIQEKVQEEDLEETLKKALEDVMQEDVQEEDNT